MLIDLYTFKYTVPNSCKFVPPELAFVTERFPIYDRGSGLVNFSLKISNVPSPQNEPEIKFFFTIFSAQSVTHKNSMLTNGRIIMIITTAYSAGKYTTAQTISHFSVG